MSRTCESCGRTWRGGATFCGACGDLLPDALAATVVRTPGTGGEPRRSLLAVALGIAVLAGAAAVPTLAIERTPPVTGEIGVPATDDLQAAPDGEPRRRQVPAPEVTCSRGGDPVDCVVWSRDLLGPPSRDGEQGWPIGVGDHVLLAGQESLEGVDAATGTRLWRLDAQVWPLDFDGEVALVEGGGRGIQVLDLTTGSVRWGTAGSTHVAGDVLHDGVVLTTPDVEPHATIMARDLADGAELWRWSGEWSFTHVIAVVGDRVLLTPPNGDPGLVILDLRTGEELGRSDVRTSWWSLGTVDETLLLAEPIEPDGDGGGNPAGDAGAVLRGISLDDATVEWERAVPASEVNFGLVEGTVLAPSAGQLAAFVTATGEVAWQVPLAPGERVGYHGPDQFFQHADRPRLPRVVATVQAFDRLVRGRDPATGTVVWERTLDEAEVHDIGVTGDVVWVALGDGFIVLDAATGEERLHVHSRYPWPTSLDPLLLFHHESGTVTRLALPEEDER